MALVPYQRAEASEEEKVHHLNNLHIKTILKESHGKPVQQLVFNHADEDKDQLFATVGEDQATVYDNNHFTHYVDVVCHFVNQKTDHTPGGVLNTCCWLPSSDSREEFGDSLLAVAGKDNVVSIISVTRSRVIGLLKGHTKPIIGLTASPSRPGQVLSLSKDNTMRLWDFWEEECLVMMEGGDVSAAEMTRDGDQVITGHKNGALKTWELPSMKSAGKRKRESTCQVVSALEGAKTIPFSESHDKPIDCIRHLSTGQLVTKSLDGRINIWDMDGKERVHALKVPGCPPTSEPSTFGVTTAGDYLAAGNQAGDVFVYHIGKDGSRVATCKPHQKVNGPVKAAAISADCRQVLSIIGAGFVCRHEYIPPQPVKEESNAASTEHENKPMIVVKEES